jgi:hypothetical protein
MPKNLLPYKYMEETKSSGLTGPAGLPMYLDLMRRLGVVQALRTHLDGNIHPFCVWKPSDIASALLMLNLSGGDNVDDLRKIQADSGFRPLFAQYLSYGLTLSERGARQKVMEAQGAGSVPSASTVFRFLKRDGTDGLEGEGKAMRISLSPERRPDSFPPATRLYWALCMQISLVNPSRWIWTRP